MHPRYFTRYERRCQSAAFIGAVGLRDLKSVADPTDLMVLDRHWLCQTEPIGAEIAVAIFDEAHQWPTPLDLSIRADAPAVHICARRDPA